MAIRIAALVSILFVTGCIPVISRQGGDFPPPDAGVWSGTTDGLAFSGPDGAQVVAFSCDRERGRLTVTVAGTPVEGTSPDILVNTDNAGGFAAPITSSANGQTTGLLPVGGAFQVPFASATQLRVAIGSLDPAPRYLPAPAEVQALLSTCP